MFQVFKLLLLLALLAPLVACEPKGSAGGAPEGGTSDVSRFPTPAKRGEPLEAAFYPDPLAPETGPSR